jgi:segregation and condensation protein A
MEEKNTELTQAQQGKQTELMDFLFNQNQINWQNMLYELVKQENMDVWNIDISKIANKYIEMVKTLKGLNFHVCGKIILAAAILLKLKSEQLLNGDIENFDLLFAKSNDENTWSELEGFFEGAGLGLRQDLEELRKQKPLVVPRSPQPRQRKVSIYDLISALEKALESNVRKPLHLHSNNFKLPDKKVDISVVIKDIYAKVIDFFEAEQQRNITFSELLPENPTNFDKVYTFVPLLHLTNDRKIDLLQNEPFGEIEITLRKPAQTTLTSIPQTAAQ